MMKITRPSYLITKDSREAIQRISEEMLSGTSTAESFALQAAQSLSNMAVYFGLGAGIGNIMSQSMFSNLASNPALYNLARTKVQSTVTNVMQSSSSAADNYVEKKRRRIWKRRVITEFLI